MVYYILTDVAGKHGWCSGGASGFVEIDRGVVPGVVDRFRTKAEAARERMRMKKKDCHLVVARREVVVVAIRGSLPGGGNDIVEFTTAAKARSFQKAMQADGWETAIEITRPAKRKVAR
jgi:hypothetical protein